MLEKIIRHSIIALGLAGMVAACDQVEDKETDTENLEQEPYGCEGGSVFEETEPNTAYSGEINMRFYANPTGILFDGGELLTIDISGEGCWYPDMCQGPDQVPQETWGVYAGYRQMAGESPVNLFQVGSHYEGIVELPPGGTHELMLVIPDGNYETSCDETLYQDNSGYFDAEVRKEYVEPDAGTDGGI